MHRRRKWSEQDPERGRPKMLDGIPVLLIGPAEAVQADQSIAVNCNVLVTDMVSQHMHRCVAPKIGSFSKRQISRPVAQPGLLCAQFCMASLYAWCHCKLPSHIVMKQCGYLHRGHLCCLGLYPRQDTAERQPCRAVGTPRRHDDGAPSPRPAGHPLHYCDTHSKSLSTLRIELSPRGVPQCLHVSGFLLYLRATYPAPLSEILRYLPRGLSPTDQ